MPKKSHITKRGTAKADASEWDGHYICDGCDKRITTLRYSCQECDDTDFCEACIGLARSDHHGHKFLTFETEYGDHVMKYLAAMDYASDIVEGLGMESSLQAMVLSSKPADTELLLRKQIETIASRKPRFLFRGWRPTSGGHHGLNTEDAIKPLPFTQDDPPKTIHDINRETFVTIARHHLAGAHTSTVFSSWSQSLAWALTMGGYSDDASQQGGISIIDTSRLPRHNVVLHSLGLGAISEWIHGYEAEYLVFGVISGDAHKAVSFADFTAMADVLMMRDVYIHTQQPHSATMPSRSKVIELALGTGKLFGEPFALPVAAYILAMRGLAVEDEETLSALCELPAPRDWSEDEAIMAFEKFGPDWNESFAALKLLRAVVENRYGRRADMVGKTKADDSPEMDMERTPQKKAAQALVHSSRMPRELKSLSIDMLGWDRGSLGLLKMVPRSLY